MITIGTLTFPTSWAAIAAAFLITSGILYVVKKKVIADYYGNAIFLFILVWKLSVILFQFKLTMNHPFTLLYFTGGIRGYWLGLAIALSYMFVKWRKQLVEIRNILFVWLLTAAMYELVISILNDYHFWLKAILVIVNIGFIVIACMKKDYVQWLQQLVILFTFVQVLLYSFSTGLFTAPIMTYIIVAVILSLLNKMRGG